MTESWFLYCRIRQGFGAKERGDLREDRMLLKTHSKRQRNCRPFSKYANIMVRQPDFRQHRGCTTLLVFLMRSRSFLMRWS